MKGRELFLIPKDKGRGPPELTETLSAAGQANRDSQGWGYSGQSWIRRQKPQSSSNAEFNLQNLLVIKYWG